MGPGLRRDDAVGVSEASAKLALRVPGFVRQHAEIDPDLAQRALVLLLDIVAEDQVWIGVAMQPAIVLDFVFQLSRRPAGIAQRQDRMLRSRTFCDRLE